MITTKLVDGNIVVYGVQGRERGVACVDLRQTPRATSADRAYDMLKVTMVSYVWVTTGSSAVTVCTAYALDLLDILQTAHRLKITDRAAIRYFGLLCNNADGVGAPGGHRWIWEDNQGGHLFCFGAVLK